MFVDEVDIEIAAGHGGPGAMSFRREKFVPRGGPDGGNGGAGGSVYLVASDHINTLVNFRFHPEHHADNGKPGSGSNRTGGTGKDLVLEVPIGTLVHSQPMPEGGEAVGPPPESEWALFADLAEPGQRVLAAQGGKGGLGNAFYATSTNRAPRKSQPGLPGQALRLRLHLKLLADVGLVGYPNAGKSTLISRVSAAKPKIADYPFTTLTPNLGVVLMRDDRSFVVADVPGLIEGAHTGHGLGDRFLKHLERTKVLLVLVDVSGLSGRMPADDLDVLRRELSLFDAGLGSKPQLVVANKIDAATDESLVASLQSRARELGLPFYKISAVAGTGLQPLLEAAWTILAEARAAQKTAIDLSAADADTA